MGFRSVALAVGFALACAAAVVVPPYVYAAYLLFNPPPIFEVDRSAKGSQQLFMVYISEDQKLLGPFSRMRAEAEMEAYKDAGAELMVPDGRLGYMFIKGK